MASVNQKYSPKISVKPKIDLPSVGENIHNIPFSFSLPLHCRLTSSPPLKGPKNDDFRGGVLEGLSTKAKDKIEMIDEWFYWTFEQSWNS